MNKLYEIYQNQLGDCFLLSAVGSILVKRPDFVEEFLTINEKEIIASYFERRQNCWQKFWKIKNKTKVSCSKFLDTDEFSKTPWVAYLEKNYAQYIGGIDKLRQGGWSFSTLYQLTGNEVEMLYTVSVPKETLVPKLLSLKSDNVFVADTFGADFTNRFPTLNIVPNHCYTVIDMDDIFITLRNPWGYFEPADDYINDGIFRLTWEDFYKVFIRINYCKPN